MVLPTYGSAKIPEFKDEVSMAEQSTTKKSNINLQEDALPCLNTYSVRVKNCGHLYALLIIRKRGPVKNIDSIVQP